MKLKYLKENKKNLLTVPIEVDLDKVFYFVRYQWIRDTGETDEFFSLLIKRDTRMPTSKVIDLIGINNQDIKKIALLYIDTMMEEGNRHSLETDIAREMVNRIKIFPEYVYDIKKGLKKLKKQFDQKTS